MTREQSLWAQQHDWFVQEFFDERCGYYITVREVWSDGTVYIVEFDSYCDLREWAGY